MKSKVLKLKTEALRRLNQLGCSKKEIDQFKNINEVPMSGDITTPSIIYTFGMVERLEREYGLLVYYVNFTGGLASLFFVSDDVSEWEMQREELNYNETTAFVFNMTSPNSSEFGTIGFKKIDGKLIRTY